MSTRYVCPYEPLPRGASFDAFLKRTSRRDNFLRRKKWLEKQEGYRIEKTEAPGALAGPLTDFVKIDGATVTVGRPEDRYHDRLSLEFDP